MTKGAVVPVADVWRLARPWYADRLDLQWMPKAAEQIEHLLMDAGLTGAFWRVTASSRG